MCAHKNKINENHNWKEKYNGNSYGMKSVMEKHQKHGEIKIAEKSETVAIKMMFVKETSNKNEICGKICTWNETQVWM